MTRTPQDLFEDRIATAPCALKAFFAEIQQNFDRDNIAFVHYTKTNGGDMRLAIPGSHLGQQRDRNFATLCWRPSVMIVFCRTFLTPDELLPFQIVDARKPTSPSEPLNSDVCLGEDVWRNGASNFIRALDAAKAKMLK